MSKRKTTTEGPAMATTTISLPEEEFLALKHLAVERRTTLRDLVRDAVTQLLKDAKKGGRR
jgi:hypothetical protein